MRDTHTLTYTVYIVEAVTGIFCSVHEGHGAHFSRRIFGHRIDLKWSENDQAEFPRLKSRKTDFSSKNRPKKQVFLNFDQVNSMGNQPKFVYVIAKHSRT